MGAATKKFGEWEITTNFDGTVTVSKNGRRILTGDPQILILDMAKRIEALEERIHSITEVR